MDGGVNQQHVVGCLYQSLGYWFFRVADVGGYVGRRLVGGSAHIVVLEQGDLPDGCVAGSEGAYCLDLTTGYALYTAGVKSDETLALEQAQRACGTCEVPTGCDVFSECDPAPGAEAVALGQGAELEGFCYLAVVKPEHRGAAAACAGVGPTVARLLELPREYFDDGALRAVRLHETSEGVLHASPGGGNVALTDLGSFGGGARPGLGDFVVAGVGFGTASAVTTGVVVAALASAMPPEFWMRQFHKLTLRGIGLVEPWPDVIATGGLVLAGGGSVEMVQLAQQRYNGGLGVAVFSPAVDLENGGKFHVRGVIPGREVVAIGMVTPAAGVERGRTEWFGLEGGSRVSVELNLPGIVASVFFLKVLGNRLIAGLPEKDLFKVGD